MTIENPVRIINQIIPNRNQANGQRIEQNNESFFSALPLSVKWILIPSSIEHKKGIPPKKFNTQGD